MARIRNPLTKRLLFFVFTVLILHIESENVDESIVRGNRASFRNHIKPKNVKPVEYKLAMDPKCRMDVDSYCPNSMLDNNYHVLDCLHDEKTLPSLSSDCQHVIWQFKKNLTQDIRFDNAMNKACIITLRKIPECKNLKKGEGTIIPCLIENRLNLTEESDLECKKFLTRVSALVFTDYRLVQHFIEDCSDDIIKNKCGRIESLPNVNEEETHLQHGHRKTIECLYKRTDEKNSLSSKCEQRVFRLAELQADDYHLDRVLYYACKDDREKFCSDIVSGEGKVYRCLFKHKMQEDMSAACQQQLRKRQKLGMKDFKIRHAIAQTCKHDIKRLFCMKDANRHSEHHVKLAQILECLENAMEKTDFELRPECLTEVRNLKRELLEDYSITPGIMINCQSEIKNKCNGFSKSGRILHCLMKESILDKDQRGVNEKCFEALKKLMNIARPIIDFKVDPVLHQDCTPVANKYCSEIENSKEVYECLLDKIGSKGMTEDCESRLFEMEYFAQRNIHLQPMLFKVCIEDIKKFCSTSEGSNWAKSYIFACLYQSRSGAGKSERLSLECEKGLQKTMRIRALKVQLDPELEIYCLRDLGTYCNRRKGLGEETNCLMDNIDKITNLTCKDAVKKRLSFRMDNPLDLNEILAKACAPMVAEFCHDVNDEDIISCLITHKTRRDMNEKCASGIEHHQILTLKDYRFSKKLKSNCFGSVKKICGDNIIKKNDVIHCLSEAIHNDTLLGQNQRVEKNCRNQIKFEVLSRSENINLDSRLKYHCHEDIKDHCIGINPGRGRVIRCLKKHMDELLDDCYKFVFQQEKEESFLGDVADFYFMQRCGDMINTYCKDKKHQSLKCLKRHKNEPNFDDSCRDAILEKQEERSRDIELQPTLHKACQRDITKHCSKIMADRNIDNRRASGLVVNCLRNSFRKKKLSKDCRNEVAMVIRKSAIDYKQDPVLARRCKKHIEKFCTEAIAADFDADGAIIDCLKENFKNGNLRKLDTELKREGKTKGLCVHEVVRVLNESRIDIHFDPILFRACSDELNHHCSNVKRGEGLLLSCLLSVLESKSEEIVDKCKRELKSRKEMWALAMEPQAPQNFVEIASHMSQSPIRNQIMVFGMLVIGVIFIGGLFCGRVTKRVARVAKNK